MTRIHKRARATFFSPEGTKDRPVELTDLADERVTYFEYADGRKETFTDNWGKAGNPKGPSPERFVGKQTTLLEPTPLQQPVPQQQLQQQEPEAPQPLFKQPTKGLKEQSTEDTFRLRLEQTSSGTLDDFRKALLEQLSEKGPATGQPYTCGLTFRLAGCVCTTSSGRHFLCRKIRALKSSLATVA